MTLLRRAEHALELLDSPEHEAPVLEESLSQVAAVNRWLGGRRALLAHVDALFPPRGPASLLDAGTGSADLPRAIVDYARRAGRTVSLRATDAHPQMVEIARRACIDYPEITVSRADVLRLPFDDGEFDGATLAMTLHHMEDDEPVRCIRELARVSRRAVLISDLERSLPNWLGAVVLGATIWRRNRLTRHDGPLSVRRSFTAAELLQLAERAGFSGARTHRHFPYRLVLIVPIGK
ncbi:MAG TPA: methyltransferase domain-containing protein [Longimicrobiales bacterium]|nr:methyltransferase domain-containing protein [Longimicrobiales bacterium]